MPSSERPTILTHLGLWAAKARHHAAASLWARGGICLFASVRFKQVVGAPQRVKQTITVSHELLPALIKELPDDTVIILQRLVPDGQRTRH